MRNSQDSQALAISGLLRPKNGLRLLVIETEISGIFSQVYLRILRSVSGFSGIFLRFLRPGFPCILGLNGVKSVKVRKLAMKTSYEHTASNCKAHNLPKHRIHAFLLFLVPAFMHTHRNRLYSLRYAFGLPLSIHDAHPHCQYRRNTY